MQPTEFKDRNADLVTRGIDTLLNAIGFDFLVISGQIFLQPGVRSPAKGVDSCAVFKNGTWKDFKDGEHGDLIELIRRAQGFEKPIEALKWARGFLGLGPLVSGRRISDEEMAAADRRARERIQAEEVKRAEDEEASAARYFQLPAAAGTLVQTYLETARRIDFDYLGHFPGVLKFEEDARYYYDGDVRNFEMLPAMVAAMYRRGRIVGIHRTFLKPDGSDKADLGLDPRGKPYKVRKYRGSKGIIPLHKGETGLAAAEAKRRNKKSTLAVCEGIEDALSVAMARPDYRVWAAGDKDNMAKIDWPDIASGVVLVADNDGDTPEEQERNFAKVEARWRGMAQGRPLVVRRSLHGKDFNDWLRADD
jgi:hypothetical protein